MNPKIEEIVKSLRGCSADVMDCENCVAGLFHRAWCCDTLRLYAADLIEQLQQELIDAQPIVRCKNCVLRGDVGKCPM